MKNSFLKLVIIALSIAVITSGFAFNLLNTSNKGVSANVARISLIPPASIKFALGGYGERMSKAAKGIHDTIWAKALVLKKDNKKFAIITIDVLGLPPNIKAQLLAKISENGWTNENLMLLPSHSHSSFDMPALNDKNKLNSPQIGIYQPELLDFFIETLSNLMKSADKNYQPVVIGTKNITIENFNRNRRGDPDIDKNLTVTRIDYKNGKPMAVLTNWTAHPTFMGGKDMYVSGGWPGYLQRDLEQKIGDGVTVMYYNGAEGDQSPIGKGGDSGYEKAEIYGKAMADQTFKLYQDIKPKARIKLEYNYTIIDLPDRKMHPSFMETGGKEYDLSPESLDAVLNVMAPAKSSVGSVRIGDLMIVGIPGELAAGLGLQIKSNLKAKGIKCPTIGGLANEWISYILSADQYNNGAGYESSVSFYGENLGNVILEGANKSAKALCEK